MQPARIILNLVLALGPRVNGNTGRHQVSYFVVLVLARL